MNRTGPITEVIFAASLRCHTKAYLLHTAEIGNPDELTLVERELSDLYRQRVKDNLKTNVSEVSLHNGMPQNLGLSPSWPRIGNGRDQDRAGR